MIFDRHRLKKLLVSLNGNAAVYGLGISTSQQVEPIIGDRRWCHCREYIKPRPTAKTRIANTFSDPLAELNRRPRPWKRSDQMRESTDPTRQRIANRLTGQTIPPKRSGSTDTRSMLQQSDLCIDTDQRFQNLRRVMIMHSLCIPFGKSTGDLLLHPRLIGRDHRSRFGSAAPPVKQIDGQEFSTIYRIVFADQCLVP